MQLPLLIFLLIIQFSYASCLPNKNIINPSDITSMSTSVVINQVISHLIKQGKDAIHDHYLRKEKVPIYSTRQSESHTQQIVIHSGYQAEILKKHSHFTLRNDKIPHNISKDNFIYKSSQVTRQHKSLIKSPPTFKSPHNKIFSSKKKNRENNSFSVNNSPRPASQNPLKEKENQMIKLDLSQRNRIVVERARLREENEEQSMRQKKRLLLLREYQEKKSNETFLKEREERQAEKEKMLESHLKKGNNFSFNFDNDGELMLFEASNGLPSTYAPQTSFKIQNQEDEFSDPTMFPTPNQFQRHKSSEFNKQMKNIEKNGFNENQRIRSARGEAFASAVMKTVNLSRISMNGSLAEIDADQFMKRNDLFNNNHSRQTTSIPYLQPNPGTIYTEIATKQAVGSIKPQSSTTANLFKDDTENEFKELPKKEKVFEGFHRTGRHYSKTARADGIEGESSDDAGKNVRPIKTAGENLRRGSFTQRRPQTSTNRGRITTANEYLVQSLLQ